MQRKAGKPSDEELLALSWDLGNKWKNLGRSLGIPEPQIEMIDEDHRKVYDKTYNMLLTWKQGCAGEASYQSLEHGLRHVIVLRNDLAEKYCYTPVQQRGPIVQEHIE